MAGLGGRGRPPTPLVVPAEAGTQLFILLNSRVWIGQMDPSLRWDDSN